MSDLFCETPHVRKIEPRDREGLPPGHVYIGRGEYRYYGISRSKWCNPEPVDKDKSRPLAERHAEAVANYAAWIVTQPDKMAALPELTGKVLVCHCEQSLPCHGQVLLRLANPP